MVYGSCFHCGCAKHECECREREVVIEVKAQVYDPEFRTLKDDIDDAELDFAPST